MSRGRLDQCGSNMWERRKTVGGFETSMYAGGGCPNHFGISVAGFASSDGRKFEGTVNERVGVCYIQPLLKREEIMSYGVIVRCVEWADEMCVGT